MGKWKKRGAKGAKSAQQQKTVDATGREGATRERLQKANGQVHVQNGVQYLRDDTLDKALDRGDITHRQYEAGKKYRHHWYNSGMAGSLQSCDWNRVGFSADFSAGMPRTEVEAHHRKQYRLAKAELESFSVLLFEAIESFVCREIGVVAIGSNRWGNRPQAQAGATERIVHGLDVLARLYGI